MLGLQSRDAFLAGTTEPGGQGYGTEKTLMALTFLPGATP